MRTEKSTYSHCWASSSDGSAPISESSIPWAASIWNGEDLGYLYLHDGLWNGKQIVSKEWVKDSRNAYVAAGDSFQYGFKWWLYLLECKFVWMARGFGGQRLMVFPQEDLIAVFTGCEILNAPAPTKELVDRLLPAVKQTACPGQQEI